MLECLETEVAMAYVWNSLFFVPTPTLPTVCSLGSGPDFKTEKRLLGVVYGAGLIRLLWLGFSCARHEIMDT